MNAQTNPIHPAIAEFRNLISLLPQRGTEMEGGRYVGAILLNDHIEGVVVAPKDVGEFKAQWGAKEKLIAATHMADGRANTLAMAEAGSKIAQKIRGLEINGKNDWHIPARDEKELCFRVGKPTAQQNYCWFRSGENPNSFPMGTIYLPEFPLQSELEGFRPGEAYAFDEAWYWTSTQYSASLAFCQGFGGGGQGSYGKGSSLRVRAVRRFVIA